MRGEASRPIRRETDGGAELHLEGVILLGPDTVAPTLSGLSLSLDRTGLTVAAAGSGPRLLGWGAIDGWRVDPSIDGAILSVQIPGRLYRFFTPGQDPAVLTFLVDGIRRPRETGPAEAAAVTASSGATPAAPATGPRAVRGRVRHRVGFARWHPVLVVLLVVVLAASVALVLAQSAGAIHLPFLGGNGAVASLPAG